MMGEHLAFLRNRTAWVLAVALVALVAARYWQLRQGATGPSAGRQAEAHLLVSAEVLAANLEREDVRVVDLRSRHAYREGHIPGAVHVPFTALWSSRDGVPGLLPDRESAEALIREAGIGADTTVVGYGDDNGLKAARLFWALDVFGQGGGHLLDGGWNAWVEGGHPVTDEVPRVQPSDFVVKLRPEAFAVLEEVDAHLGNAGTRLVDTRSADEYVGEDVRSTRGGHIPGAYNVHWKRHLDSERGRFRSLDALTRLYEPLDLDSAERIITYSRTHVRAAHTYFVLRLLGYDNVAGYDGSWAEWASHPDTVASTEPQALPEAEAIASTRADGDEQPDRSSATLREGLSMEEARQIVGSPAEVERQETCWGTQTTWIFPDGVAGRDGPIRLVFSAGSLSRIE